MDLPSRTPTTRSRRTPAPEPVLLPVHEVLALDREPPLIPEARGLRVRRYASGVAFSGALRTFRRGVIALAVPPGTPRDVALVAEVRAGRPGIRALLVDDAAGPDQRVGALAAGFDDAVPASAGPHEIAGRLAVLGDRTREEIRDRLPVAPGRELDLTARALRRNGRLVHLRPMEFGLLEELARNPGRPISREALLQRVWGIEGTSLSRTVDVHMRWLRAKVEVDPEHPRHLLTVRGVGYQLELLGEGDDPDEPGP
ncbi:MAG: winged helix-turn-helix domain-containing protein [Chloroflexota bacterium]